jgi:hypothetical protein
LPADLDINPLAESLQELSRRPIGLTGIMKKDICGAAYLRYRFNKGFAFLARKQLP